MEVEIFYDLSKSSDKYHPSPIIKNKVIPIGGDKHHNPLYPHLSCYLFAVQVWVNDPSIMLKWTAE